MKLLSRISEQYFNLISAGKSGIRSAFRSISGKWWTDRPVQDKTVVNYDYTRSLYRNDLPTIWLGGGFAAPIVDTTVSFMGLPYVDSGDETRDDFLNNAINKHWSPKLQEMFRNSIRDSKTVVRIRRPDIADPLASPEEISYCYLEIVDPERVVIYRGPDTGRADQAIVTHYVEFFDFSAVDIGSRTTPTVTEHKILEYITPEMFRYYDTYSNQWLDTWEMENVWGFIPLVEVYNEYDSSLSGGQSDLEKPLPFIQGFHDVLCQSMQAHKYHSTPKVKFKINDVQTFLKNNFPDSFSEDGTFSGNITWRGKEILFLQSEEDADFIEAKSVLGDSKTLLEFLLDCICISSETPEWAFMRIEQATQGALNAQSEPLEKKIDRKRISFTEPIQVLCKMLLSINRQAIVCPGVNWRVTNAQKLTVWTQALQQLVMALETAAQRQIISDTTYREVMRVFLPQMKGPEEEKREAAKNKPLPVGTPVNSTGEPDGENE